MFVNLSISLAEGESAPSQEAREILAYLGGDPATDTINMTVTQISAPIQPTQLPSSPPTPA
jgi:hypothetical protein